MLILAMFVNHLLIRIHIQLSLNKPDSIWLSAEYEVALRLWSGQETLSCNSHFHNHIVEVNEEKRRQGKEWHEQVNNNSNMRRMSKSCQLACRSKVNTKRRHSD